MESDKGSKDTLVKGDLRIVGRFEEPTSEIGEPRISCFWELLLPMGLKRWDGVGGRGMVKTELL